MLNPNEIANRKFDRAMGRGYRVEEVDNYLAQIAREVDDLLEEKRELEEKLMVLAEKLEEYKRDEESLHAALLGAQKLGDSVVRDAKARAQSILDDANIRASQLVDNAKSAIEQKQHAFIRMQREVATFKSRLQLVYKQHLELISSIPVDEDLMQVIMNKESAAQPAAERPTEEQPPKEEAAVSTPSQEEFSGNVQTPSDEEGDFELPDLQYQEEEEFIPEPPEQVQAPHRQPKQRETSRFGPLKFGKDFDLKRDDDKRRK